MSNEEKKPEAPPAPEPADQYTKEAHMLYDFWMRRLTGDGWKVLSCVVRKAWGWHHAGAFISLTEFMEMTGLPTKTVVLRAIRECEQRGALVIGKETDKDGSKSYFIPQSALGGTTLVPSNPRKKKRKGHAPGIRKVHAGVPPGYQEGYQAGTSPSARVIPDARRSAAAEGNQEEGRDDTKRQAKDTSLKKDVNKGKDMPSSALLRTGAPHVAPPGGAGNSAEKKTGDARRQASTPLPFTLSSAYDASEGSTESGRGPGRTHS